MLTFTIKKIINNKEPSDEELDKKIIEAAPNYLIKMTDYEKSIIYYMFNKQNKTQELPINDGVIIKLENMRIISKVTNFSANNDLSNPTFYFVLTPWIDNIVKNNNEVYSSLKKGHTNFIEKERQDAHH